MQVSSRLILPFRLAWRDGREAWRFTRKWFARHWWKVLLVLGIVVLPALLGLHALDDERPLVFNLKDKAASQIVRSLAQSLSYWGDFVGFNLGIFLGLQVAGWVLRSRRLMRVAVASLLCACLCGITANVARSLTGRPRPSTGELVWRGPTLSSDYHALPSAHTATAFGGALPVLFSMPLVGVPATGLAAGVCWSRLQLRRHHLTDVLTSLCLAFVVSLPLTRWALRYSSPKRSAPTAPHVFTAARIPH